MRLLISTTVTLAVLAAASPAVAARQSTTVQVDCRNTLQLGATTDVDAKLFDATGAQLGHEPLTLTREDEFDPPADLGPQASSSSAWAFWNDVPPNRGNVTWTVTYAGDNHHGPATASCSTLVIGSVTHVVVDPEPPSLTDEPITISGRLTASDGAVLAGRTIDVDDTGTPLPSVTTEADGRFSFTVPPPLTAGYHHITMHTAADRVYEGASATEVRLVREPTSITIEGPDALPSNGNTRIVVTLRSSHGDPVPGVYLDLTFNGVGEHDAGITDDNGQVRINRLFPAHDPLLLTASFVPSPSRDVEWSWAPSETTRLWKGVPLYGLWSPHPTHTFGQSETFTANQSITSLMPYVAPGITVTWRTGDGTPETIDHREDVSQATFTRTLSRNSTVTVSSPATYYYQAGERVFSIGVAPLLQQSVTRSWSRDGRTYLVRRSSSPTFRLTARPNRAGTCAHLRVQRDSGSGWQPWTRTACRRLDTTSSTSWRLARAVRVGDRYRARWETEADASNTEGTGAWQVVQFTR